MGDNDNRDSGYENDQLHLEILAERLEFYRIMAWVFYNKLDKDDRIDALVEIVELLKKDNENV